MCDRTPNCPDRKLLPVQLEIVRECSDVLPFSGAERNYREACIDLMLECNERIHTDGAMTDAIVNEIEAMTEHLRDGLERLDRTGIDRLPFGDPRRKEIERIRVRHLEAVREINQRAGDKIESFHRSMKDGHPPEEHEALLSLKRAIKNAELLPMTNDERHIYGERVERLREIGGKIHDSSPIIGLAMIVESIKLVREQCALERKVAERVGPEDKNYEKIREIWFKEAKEV